MSLTSVPPKSEARFRLVILMPVYNDWECAALLCADLDRQLSRLNGIDARVLLVDDGSPDGIGSWPAIRCSNIAAIHTLRLTRNLGHQRAICTGLCYIREKLTCDAVLVLDADGEDQPEDAIRLIERVRTNPSCVTFAERRRRQEGIIFRTGYTLFRLGHRVLTGIPVRVGNFSVVPFAVLTRLVCMPELWNHFAGAIYKSKARFDSIPMNRGKRLRGKSHMDLPSLVAHGLAGIATFHEMVATRILISNVICLVLLTAALLVMAGVALATKRTFPEWGIYAAGVVLVLVIQLFAMSFSLVFTLISNRSHMPFVPRRDYGAFVDEIVRLEGSLEVKARGASA